MIINGGDNMEKGHFLKGIHDSGETLYAVSLSNDTYITNDGMILNEYAAQQYKLHHTRNVNPEIKRMLFEIADLQENNISISNKLKDLEIKVKEMKDTLPINHSRISDLVCEVNILRLESEITGKEIFSMASYNENVDKAKVICVVKKTNRPIYYAYGLYYSDEDVNKITKQKAIERLKKRVSFFNIKATDSKIMINEYSMNDLGYRLK